MSSSMNSVNQAGTAQPATFPSNDIIKRAEKADFLKKTSITDACGQRAINDIAQNSNSTDSDDDDLAGLVNLLNVTEEKAAAEAQFGEGDQLAELGAKKEELGAKIEELGAKKEELGALQQALGAAEAKIQEQQRDTSQAKEVASLSDLLDSSNAMNNVSFISHIHEDKVTLHAGTKLSGQQLQQAHSNNKTAVIHDGKLFVHPNLGLAHGQKVTLSDGREVIVHHFTPAQILQLSQVLVNYIAQLAKKDKVEGSDQDKKREPSSPTMADHVIVHIKHNRENAKREEAHLRESERNKSPSFAKMAEVYVSAERTKEHEIAVIDQICIKIITILSDQCKKFDNAKQALFLNNLKVDRFVRQIPHELLAHA